jgi:hypothetical protein
MAFNYPPTSRRAPDAGECVHAPFDQSDSMILSDFAKFCAIPLARRL